MTKVRIDLREAVANELGGHITHIPATVDVDELFEFNDIYETELDLQDVLDENRLIAHLWGIGDVQHERPHLSNDQAWEVLKAVESRMNSEFGINWDFVRDVADELYPQPPEPTTSNPTNDDRAGWARNALAVFTSETFGKDHPDMMDTDDLQCAIADLICDLLHYARRKEFDTAGLMEQATRNFDAELAEETQP